MALVVPDQGEVIALEAFLNKTAPQDQYLKLYATNVTPAEGDTEASYTEAVGGGYSHIALSGASWTVATSGGITTGSYAQQTFTFTGALTTNATIYGYLVVQETSGKLIFSEKAGSSFTPANNGDTFKVTLNITAE